MANSIWQATIQNEAGDIIPGAEITVTDEDTGLPATIFSTIGGAAKSNPFFADSNGFAQFYAGSGTYRVNAEDTGTGQSQLWRYIRFGDASSRDVGTSAGNIPDADDLSMVGATENYTSNNLNTNVFGGTLVSDYVASGEANNATSASFLLPISMESKPSSITTIGTFDIVNVSNSIVFGAGLTPTLSPVSGNKLAYIIVSGASGLTVGQTYYLRQNSSLSKITVNQ